MAFISMQLIPYGGVMGATVSCIVAEMVSAKSRGHDMRFIRTDGDSLLPRRRSIALSQFYERSTDDVMVTIDHDISWNPGDVVKVAEKALEMTAIVGGLYSKRAEGQGWASRLSLVGTIRIPSDEVVKTEYVGSGFMAIPRSVIRKMLEDPAKAALTRCWDGRFEYWDYYHTMAVPHKQRPELYEYLSEDWAFCERVKMAGIECYTDLRPRIVHYGERAFNACDGLPKLNSPNINNASNANG
jgi:hypothetical protein